MKSELVKINAESHVKFLQKNLSYQRMIFLRFHKILKICSAGSHQIFTFLHDLPFHALPIDPCNTVGINPILSDLNTPRTLNWAGGTLKPIKMIGMNSRFAKIYKKAQEKKMAEQLNNFEKFEQQKFQACVFSTQRPPDD